MAIIGLAAMGIVVYIGATKENEIEPVLVEDKEIEPVLVEDKEIEPGLVKDFCEDSGKSLNRYTLEAAASSKCIDVSLSHLKFYE